MGDAERIIALERICSQMVDRFLELQGRLNALELTVTMTTLCFSKIQPNPFQYVQNYVEAVRQTSKELQPHNDDASNGERLVRESRIAIDELLELLIRHSGQLHGAPVSTRPERGASPS